MPQTTTMYCFSGTMYCLSPCYARMAGTSLHSRSEPPQCHATRRTWLPACAADAERPLAPAWAPSVRCGAPPPPPPLPRPRSAPPAASSSSSAAAARPLAMPRSSRFRSLESSAAAAPTAWCRKGGGQEPVARMDAAAVGRGGSCIQPHAVRRPLTTLCLGGGGRLTGNGSGRPMASISNGESSGGGGGETREGETPSRHGAGPVLRQVRPPP